MRHSVYATPPHQSTKAHQRNLIHVSSKCYIGISVTK